MAVEPNSVLSGMGGRRFGASSFTGGRPRPLRVCGLATVDALSSAVN